MDPGTHLPPMMPPSGRPPFSQNCVNFFGVVKRAAVNARISAVATDIFDDPSSCTVGIYGVLTHSLKDRETIASITRSVFWSAAIYRRFAFNDGSSRQHATTL